jgi:hypothetical protein
MVFVKKLYIYQIRLYFLDEINIETPKGRLKSLSKANSDLKIWYRILLEILLLLCKVASEPAPTLINLSGISLLINLKAIMGTNKIVLK